MLAPNRIDKVKLEVFGSKLRIMWHFRKDERTIHCSKKFRPKSIYNPKNKDVILETYLSSLEEKLLDIDIPKGKFNNLSKVESDAMYSLKIDNTIVIKGADKGSGVIAWDRKDYLKEVHEKLSDEEVYEEVTSNPSKFESRARSDIFVDLLAYFLNKDPEFVKHYLLSKSYGRFRNVPGRAVISNCGY